MEKYIPNIISNTLFSVEECLSYQAEIFKQSALGKIQEILPLKKLGDLLPKKQTDVGAPSWFSPSGMFGVMFLKAYLGLSDEKLIDRINSDWQLQMFCGIQLKLNEKIRDKSIISRIRSYLGDNLDIDKFQTLMLEEWKPLMNQTHCVLIDATVYESSIKYPTDVKLLWDCSIWVLETIFAICKLWGIKRPRNKYKEQKGKQTDFSKKKRKTYKQIHKRKRSLLNLLNKSIGQLEYIIENPKGSLPIKLNIAIEQKLEVVKTVLEQQQYMFDNPGESVKHRIVSFFKPYLRPIKRGKENRSTEFGVKAHIAQTDGINIIDKLDFDPYHEGKLLQESIEKHNERFGQCHQVGVDQIYGINENRKFMTKNKIHSSLKRKGKPSKYEDQAKALRKEVGKERATVLEGSFGNEKNHYTLRKVKARSKETEIIWVVFGIFTANAVRVSKRNTSVKVAA